jgi:general secretion pathway protein A
MYLSHFQLQTEPFRISPDPEFLWLSEKHARGFETLREGILNRDGCVLLTGDIGTGKTTFVKRLARLDGVAPVFVTINDGDLTRLEFCNSLAAELGIDRRFDRREDVYKNFQNVLLGQFSACRKVLVVIDDAQRLKPETIREAVDLSNLQLAGRKPLKVLFVGLLDFDRLLKQEENRGLLRNITARYNMEPLTETETRRYVDHRLKVAGRDTPLFTGDAVKEVHVLSRGYPRLINIVCDHALLCGYSSGLEEIDSRVVRECSRDLTVALDLDTEPDQKDPGSSIEGAVEVPRQQGSAAVSHRWRPILYIAAALAALGLTIFAMTR